MLEVTVPQPGKNAKKQLKKWLSCVFLLLAALFVSGTPIELLDPVVGWHNKLFFGRIRPDITPKCGVIQFSKNNAYLYDEGCFLHCNLSWQVIDSISYSETWQALRVDYLAYCFMIDTRQSSSAIFWKSLITRKHRLQCHAAHSSKYPCLVRWYSETTRNSRTVAHPLQKVASIFPGFLL